MEGHFTFMDSRVFHRLLNNIACCHGDIDIHLNLKMLESIDATGLGMLLHAHDTAKKMHRHLVFANPVDKVHAALCNARQHNALKIAV